MGGTAAERRDELVAALRASGEQALEALRAVPAARYEQGRYEGGWSGRQILAHLAAIEWTYPRLLTLAAASARGESGTASVSGGIDAYNARQVERRAGSSIEELLAEFERNRAATIAAVESADAALLDRPVRTAGGLDATAGEALRWAAIDHVQGHVRDIAGG